MVSSSRWLSLVSLTFLLLCGGSLGAQTNPVNGFPNWEERVLHEWINRARVDPATDLAGCGPNCSTAEMNPSCYTPIAPLMWRYELGVAARFHTDSMARQGFFSHDTPCALRTDLSSVYPGTCDASTACSCAGSGATGPGTRVSRFGASYSGEIIAAGQVDANAAFYTWLHEPVVSSAPCGFVNSGPGNTNGHRWLILKASTSMGAGYTTGGTWGTYYSTDFGGGGPVSKIPSGAHYPRQASTIDFWANWYDTAGPASADLVVGTTRYAMTRERGTATNGAWKRTVTGLGTGCHRYYFEFRDSGGVTVRHPSSGTFGIGPAGTCAEWVDAEIPPPVLTAIAMSTASVQVTWTSSPGATQYQLERRNGGAGFASLGTVSGLAFTDTAVTPGQTYVYRIRPVGGSTWSNLDHATTIVFTDDPLIPNATQTRALHLTEIRTAVNAARATAGLVSASWTDPSPSGVPIKASHILELRTALTAALTAFGKTATYTNAVTAGAPVRAIDFQELRNAVK